MNFRRQGFLSLTMSVGAYHDEKECKTAIETILRQIERKHKKRSIPIFGFAVLSCSAKGTVEYTPWGRRHKPNTTIEPYHIHAVFATDAFSSSVKIIREYLQKCYGKGKLRHNKVLEKNMFWIKKLKTPTDAICWTYYCIGQGLCIRKTTSACNEEFIKRYCSDLISTAEKANKKIGASKPLFPQFAHLLSELIYEDSPCRKTHKISHFCHRGVDNLAANQYTESIRNATKYIPILYQNTQYKGASATYPSIIDPFSDDILNSNVINKRY